MTCGEERRGATLKQKARKKVVPVSSGKGKNSKPHRTKIDPAFFDELGRKEREREKWSEYDLRQQREDHGGDIKRKTRRRGEGGKSGRQFWVPEEKRKKWGGKGKGLPIPNFLFEVSEECIRHVWSKEGPPYKNPHSHHQSGSCPEYLLDEKEWPSKRPRKETATQNGS